MDTHWRKPRIYVISIQEVQNEDGEPTYVVKVRPKKSVKKATESQSKSNNSAETNRDRQMEDFKIMLQNKENRIHELEAVLNNQDIKRNSYELNQLQNKVNTNIFVIKRDI